MRLMNHACDCEMVAIMKGGDNKMLRYNFLKLTWVAVVVIRSHVHEMVKHDLRYRIAVGFGRCESICMHASVSFPLMDS